MTESDFTAATGELAQARRQARAVTAFPPEWVPADLAQAYRMQHAVASRLGVPAGWKVSALAPAHQRAMGVSCPVAAPLLAPWLRSSAAVFDLSGFVNPLLECEFAFELAHDLPPRAAPYTRAEVEAAIGCLRPAIEIVDSRLPAGSPPLLELADAFNNGAFVIGAAHREWSAIRFATHAISLRATSDGQTRELASGNGLPILEGDPVAAVLALANAQPGLYGGLRAGQILTTGTCTGAVPVPGACRIEAVFGTLGVVQLGFEIRQRPN